METETKRTPGPWKSQPGFMTIYAVPGLEESGCGTTTAIAAILVDQLAGGKHEAEANAAFIVQACNEHDALVQQRDALAEACDRLVAHANDNVCCQFCGNHRTKHLKACAITQARNALALAEGGAV